MIRRPPISPLFPYPPLFRSLFPRLFRPPQGLRSPWLMHVLESDSLITVTWDDAPGDWDPIPRETVARRAVLHARPGSIDRKSTRLNSSHSQISYAVFCLKKK